MDFTYDQARDLFEAFGGDEETVITVTLVTNGHSGPGLYASFTDYPEEGGIFLGDEEAP